MCILLEATPSDPRHSQFGVPNASYFRYLVFTISNTNELLAKRGLFASSPANFWNFTEKSHNFRSSIFDPILVNNLIRVWDSQNPITMTNKGIGITGQVQGLRLTRAPGALINFVLSCSFNGDSEQTVGIYPRR